jgi:hypothetical protein
MQNTGAGLHSAVSEFVDGANDGMCVVRWPGEKDKEKTTGTNNTCIVTVFGLATFTNESG